MSQTSTYQDLKNREWDLSRLDGEESRLLAELRQLAQRGDWYAFENHWTRRLTDFYHARGLARAAIFRTPLYHLAQDLSNRLAVGAGIVREPDYRDHLRDIIQASFATRRAFCEATEISEDMLSHVLAGRKDLSLGSLAKAMQRIGYKLAIVPCETVPKQLPPAG